MPDADFTRVHVARQWLRPLVSVHGVALRGVLAIAAAWVLAGAQTSGAAIRVAADATALARAVQSKRIVMLGEVHDNEVHHALRAEALAQLIAGGSRPALAFEQFDIERQPDIDRARSERPRDVDHLIAQARSRGSWRWESYRPMIALALEHDLPIVAANLSRSRAMKVATEGWSAVFDAPAAKALKLDALPREFVRTHEQAIARGHCNRLPARVLPSMARAQIARDAVLAQALRPHVHRGVVLIAGNGHARNDVGVPYWLEPDERAASISVALLERGDEEAFPTDAIPFDAFVVTPAAERANPCNDVPKQLPEPAPSGPPQPDR